MNAPPTKSEARMATGRRAEQTAGKYGHDDVLQVGTFADLDAERIVLAAMLNGCNGEFPDASLFFYPQHQAIHRGIAALTLSGTPRDITTVTQVLRETGELEKAGGAFAITQLGTDFYGRSPDIVKYELGRLYEFRAKRELHRIAELMRKGDITPEEVIEKMSEVTRECPSSLPSIQDAAALIEKPITLPDDVVVGVLHRGGKMVAGGASKSYKTWFLIDTAVSVATGTDWLDRFSTKQGRVLYINLEIQSPFFANRIKTICDERQIKLEPGMLKVWPLRGHVMDLPRLLRQIPSGKYVLIIIDPIYKLLGDRDENKAGDIASLLNEIEKLAVATGAAVAFGAHYSKGNQALKESIDRIGGSGVFARDPDSILNFTKHEESDCFTVEATLRNHPPIDPFVVRWEYPLFVVDELLDPARLKQAGRPEQHRATDLLELIDQPMSAKEIVRLAHDEFGIGRRRVFDLLDELKRCGRIKQPEK
jgi:AAA domain-containing protein/DnaB helicase-like protein